MQREVFWDLCEVRFDLGEDLWPDVDGGALELRPATVASFKEDVTYKLLLYTLHYTLISTYIHYPRAPASDSKCNADIYVYVLEQTSSCV